jgi:hypothetical protein
MGADPIMKALLLWIYQLSKDLRPNTIALALKKSQCMVQQSGTMLIKCRFEVLEVNWESGKSHNPFILSNTNS